MTEKSVENRDSSKMVDDVNVKNTTETAESKVQTAEALDRARLARERREAEQRKRLEELRAHAAAAQAQREKRDDERRRRQAEQRARDDDRRTQVEERKRAIWEASVSRREALLQREREREERLERSRSNRSVVPRSAFAFGSSTPRLLEPVDTSFFWGGRRATSTTNVMFASAPLTRRASALHLDLSDGDNNKDEPERSPQPAIWSSVARRRTDLVPTTPSRGPGRAYSMSRLDVATRPTSTAMRSPLNRIQCRSGDSTPGSRPASAMSTSMSGVSASGAVRRARASSAPRRTRPVSIADTGVHTPRGGPDTLSVATTPTVSRDGTSTNIGDGPNIGTGTPSNGTNSTDVVRRPASTPRRPRPLSAHVPLKAVPITNAGDGKPPLHRKPKLSKEHEKSNRHKSMSVSPSPSASKEPSVDKDIHKKPRDLQLSATEVTQKLEALQITNEMQNVTHDNVTEKSSQQLQEETKTPEQKPKFNEQVPIITETKPTPTKPQENMNETRKLIENERNDNAPTERTDESEMTASMTARRITTEEEAKAALAERRRKAREEFERQAELERQRVQKEAEEEAERQRLEEERQRREEQEARELALLQRQMEEEKLRKAIEAQQQLEREEQERKVREEAERVARLKEEEEKRKALEEEARLKRIEAEKEEKERLARKQRVEAIMARTRLKKAEEDKKQQQDNKSPQNNSEQQKADTNESTAHSQSGLTDVKVAVVNNGNADTDLLGLGVSSLVSEAKSDSSMGSSIQSVETVVPSNGNVADLLGMSNQDYSEDKSNQDTVQIKAQHIDHNQSTNNGNFGNHGNATNHNNQGNHGNAGNITANFLQTEIMSEQINQVNPPKAVRRPLLDEGLPTPTPSLPIRCHLHPPAASYPLDVIGPPCYGAGLH